MKPQLKLSLTPITEHSLSSVGFERVIEKDAEEGDVKFILRLPRDSSDPNCMCLISSYRSDYKELHLNEGEFVVELFDSGGMGVCFSMEEVDLLYFVLTKKNLI